MYVKFPSSELPPLDGSLLLLRCMKVIIDYMLDLSCQSHLSRERVFCTWWLARERSNAASRTSLAMKMTCLIRINIPHVNLSEEAPLRHISSSRVEYVLMIIRK